MELQYIDFCGYRVILKKVRIYYLHQFAKQCLQPHQPCCSVCQFYTYITFGFQQDQITTVRNVATSARGPLRLHETNAPRLSRVPSCPQHLALYFFFSSLFSRCKYTYFVWIYLLLSTYVYLNHLNVKETVVKSF